MKKPFLQGLKIRKIRAFETQHSSSGEYRLIVEGEVQVGVENKKIQAEESTPQGINPQILRLNFKRRPAGIGSSPIKWHKVAFEKAVSPGRFSTVDLSLEGESILQLDIGGGTRKWP